LVRLHSGATNSIFVTLAPGQQIKAVCDANPIIVAPNDWVGCEERNSGSRYDASQARNRDIFSGLSRQAAGLKVQTWKEETAIVENKAPDATSDSPNS
jgi:hypothetical protein